MEKDQLQKLTAFFFEIGNLRKVLRAHQQMLLTNDLSDNIASHSFRTAFIGYFLAKELGANADRVLKICMIHDIEEVRAGDHNWVHKKYIKVYEDEIREGQLKGLPQSEELLDLSREYHQRQTQEAKIAKDADLLDQIFLLKEYAVQGNKEAADWLKGGWDHGVYKESEQEKQMFTDLAKEIAREAKKQRQSYWWENIWTPKNRH